MIRFLFVWYKVQRNDVLPNGIRINDALGCPSARNVGCWAAIVGGSVTVCRWAICDAFEIGTDNKTGVACGEPLAPALPVISE